LPTGAEENVDDAGCTGVSPDHLNLFGNSLWRRPRRDAKQKNMVFLFRIIYFDDCFLQEVN